MKAWITLITLLLVAISQVDAQSAYGFFNANKVDALISASGNHFWDFSTNHYYVPAGDQTTSIFASTLWIGGMDENDSLHLAAERFRQVGYDFTPGPVSDPSVYAPPFNGAYNRVWKVTRYEIQAWLADPTNNPTPQSVIDWPAHGDTTQGQAFYLAPFNDMNNDGIYNPADLDHPAVRGDQMVYFIYTDDASANTETGGKKLGIEVHGVAYGFNCVEDSALDHALFFHHKIFNRSQYDYSDVHIGLWNDYDLGNAQDDYIGSDPLRNLFFAYNGDNEDQDAGGNIGYGFNLPSQGLRLLKGPKMENDGIDNPKSVVNGTYNGFGMGDSIIDNEYLGLGGFAYHHNASGPMGDPSGAADYYAMLTGKWKDGTPFSYGGNGYDPNNTNAIECRFLYPDSSDSVHLGTGGVDPMAPWHEYQSGNTPGDRRGMGSIGPVDLPPGGSIEFDHVYVFAQKMYDRIGAVHKMKAYSDHLQELFNSGTTPCGDFINVIIGQKEMATQDVRIYPNPAVQTLTVSGISPGDQISIFDLEGRRLSRINAQSNTNEVALDHLVNGVYFVKVSGSEGAFTTRFVKM